MLDTVIPKACRFIVKSGKIVNHDFLKVCNDVLENSLLLLMKEFKDIKYAGFKEIFAIVLSPEEDYFKFNNQVNLDEGKPLYYPSSEN